MGCLIWVLLGGFFVAWLAAIAQVDIGIGFFAGAVVAGVAYGVFWLLSLPFRGK